MFESSRTPPSGPHSFAFFLANGRETSNPSALLIRKVLCLLIVLFAKSVCYLRLRLSRPVAFAHSSSAVRSGIGCGAFALQHGDSGRTMRSRLFLRPRGAESMEFKWTTISPEDTKAF